MSNCYAVRAGIAADIRALGYEVAERGELVVPEDLDCTLWLDDGEIVDLIAAGQTGRTALVVSGSERVGPRRISLDAVDRWEVTA